MTENWNLLGHNWAVDMLRRHIAADETRHAYLIAGAPGLGRRTLALAFASALNCTNPPAPGDFCGECRECRQTHSMASPDLSVVSAENEGGTLKVEQVREVKRLLSLKPYQSKYRVAIFLRFQEANDNASNALLKTLEEAPAHAILMLTADSPEALLPTIVSRCEVLRLRPVGIGEVQRELEIGGRVGGGLAPYRDQRLETDQARLIAHLSGGRPGTAFRLAAEKSLLDFRAQKLDDLQKLLSSTRVDKFSYAEKLSKEKGDMRQTLMVWLSFWRDVFLRAAKADSPLTNVDRVEQVESLAAKLSLPVARQRVSEAEKAISRLERNVNARILAEVLLLGW